MHRVASSLAASHQGRLISIGSLLVAVSLVLGSAVDLPAFAQSEEEVAKARREADSAAGARSMAEDRFRTVDAQMAAALSRYEQITAELVEAVTSSAHAEELVRAHEAKVREHKTEVRQLVLRAYAGASTSDLSLVIGAGTLEDAILTNKIMARAAERTDETLTELVALRSDLDERRQGLKGAQGRIVSLRSEADALVDELALHAEAAALLVGGTRVAERKANVAYSVAVDELEAAIHSISPRAYGWRPLINAYFPAELRWEALQVLDCESRGKPDARNESSSAAGLFQFLEGTWRLASTAAGFPDADPFDPEANVASAAWLVDLSIRTDHRFGRWGRWACQLIGWPRNFD